MKGASGGAPSGLGFHSPRPLPRDHAPVEAATQTAMMLLCRSSRRCTDQCGIIGSTNTSRICQRIYGDCPYIAAREVYPLSPLLCVIATISLYPLNQSASTIAARKGRYDVVRVVVGTKPPRPTCLGRVANGYATPEYRGAPICPI